MLRTCSSIIGIVVIAVGALYAFWDTRATAASNEKKIEAMEEMRKYQEQRIKGIEDVLLKQQAAEEAEEAYRRKMCAAGKLDRSECPED